VLTLGKSFTVLKANLICTFGENFTFMSKWLLFVSLFLALFACKSTHVIDADHKSKDPLYVKAHKLAQDYIITDGHVDLPYRLTVINFRLERKYMGIPVESNEGDFDFVRAKKGGLNAPFMSIFIPASNQIDNEAKIVADSLIAMVAGIAERIPDKFELAYSPKDVERISQQGKIALPMGMENGAAILENLDNINYFRKKGISYITLTHSKDNQICDSSYDTTGTWNGLSPFGEKVIKRMNETGMMIDISHVSDSTFYQVLELTKLPVIASHSSCRKFVPGFERNMSDDMIRKIKTNGGVIHINFGSDFIDGAYTKHKNERRDQLNQILAGKGLKNDDPEAKQIIDQFARDNPILFSDVEKVADHIDHVVSLAGIDHVGFGSDFDGVGDSLPTGLKDVAAYPNLIYSLLKRGYSETDIAKICYKNTFRVWNKVLDAAKQHSTQH
jgi:membrane dipeptidase